MQYSDCIYLDKIDKDVDNRLAKANSAFGRLYKCVWNKKI